MNGPVVWYDGGPCTACTSASASFSRPAASSSVGATTSAASPSAAPYVSMTRRSRAQPDSRSCPPVSISPSVQTSIVSPGSRTSRVVG